MGLLLSESDLQWIKTLATNYDAEVQAEELTHRRQLLDGTEQIAQRFGWAIDLETGRAIYVGRDVD